MQDNAPFLVPRLTGEVFDCTIISSQQWMIFASPAITLKWTPQGLVAEQPYTGQYGRTTGRQTTGRQAAGQTGRQTDRRCLSTSGDDAKEGRTDLTACLSSACPPCRRFHPCGLRARPVVEAGAAGPLASLPERRAGAAGLQRGGHDHRAVEEEGKRAGRQAGRSLGWHSCRHSLGQQQQKLHMMGLPPCCPAADGRLFMRCAASGVCVSVCVPLARVTATRSC